jgi:uncharacterized membrane protein YhhN
MVIAAANLIGQFNYLPHLNTFAKPLICISLAIYLVRKVNMKAGFNRLVFTALMVSLFGDFFLLLMSGSTYFLMYALLVFLVAHVLYSLAFFRDFKNDPQGPKIYGHLMLFIMGAFSLSYYTWIREYLDVLRIPVMAYMFGISIMAILAGYRYQRVNLLSFKLIYGGAICFVISVSALGYNKFAAPFQFSGIAIMATYMLAQYLITIGTVERMVTSRRSDR